MPPLRPNFKRGDPLNHETINELIRRTEPPVVRGSGAVSVRTGHRGQVQVAVPSILRFVGVANGDIPARSGSSWGTGTVTRYEYDAVSGDDDSTGQDFDVVNPSSTMMSSGNGIDDGQYCWVEEDSDGNLVVTPLECS